MPTNKNAAIRYQTLDKCFRDRQHRYYMEDLIDKCEEAIYYYNGVGGVCRRQIFEDIKFMESETGWSVPLERKQDGRRVYYRYRDPDFTINAQPLTEEETRQFALSLSPSDVSEDCRATHGCMKSSPILNGDLDLGESRRI